MRADGKKTKNVFPMYKVAAHIMNKRYDAMNMITLDIPLEPIRTYLNKKKKEGIYMSHIGLFIAAYLRTLCEFPHLNRFVVNKKIYSRTEIAVGMVVLKAGDINNETMSKMYFDLEDTSFDVQKRIEEFVDDNRQSGENGTDKIINTLLSIPGLLTVGVGLFKLMDRYGLLPKAIIDVSPFHESLLISNLASIRTNHIYHHVYEFGTTSVGMTMGNMREVPKTKNGEVVLERCIPIGLVMDERIATGVYFAQAFRKFRDYLAHPEKLETPPETVILDFEGQYDKDKKRRQKLAEKKAQKMADSTSEQKEKTVAK
ncbi:MAG: 2-oxo acid dehydrogenase subunit E2 [Ruminococcaceae bacterium]|nr:2-oxo acid dehydrogenase subunit E2 [Oscillospiraceae bacterium]